jgi:hypothetical protein
MPHRERKGQERGKGRRYCGSNDCKKTSLLESCYLEGIIGSPMVYIMTEAGYQQRQTLQLTTETVANNNNNNNRKVRHE